MNRKLVTIAIALILFSFVVVETSFKPKQNRKPQKGKYNAWDIALIEGNAARDRYQIEKAKVAYRQSLKAAEEIWGKDSQQAGVSYNKLGNVSILEKDFEQAENYLSKSWSIAQAVLKDSDPRKGYALGDYADVLQSQLKYEECIKLQEQGLELLANVNPPIWRDNARAKLDLAEIYVIAGRVHDSKALVDQALEDFSRELNAPVKSEFDQKIRAESASSVLSGLIFHGAAEQALPLAIRVVDLNRSVFGENTIESARATERLAAIYQLLGQSENAEKALKNAVNALQTEDRKTILRARLFSRLSWLEHDRYNLRLAIKYAGLALDEAIGQLGKNDPELSYYYRVLAGFLVEIGNSADAMAAADKALEFALREQRSDRPDIVGALRVFTFSRILGDRKEELINKLIDVSEKSDLDSIRLNIFFKVDLLCELAEMSKMAGNLKQARAFLQMAAEVVPENVPWSIHITLQSALLEREMGQLDQALELADRGLELAEREKPKSRLHVRALRVVANTLRMKKMYVKSAQRFKEAFELMTSTPVIAEDYSLKILLLKEMSDLYQEKGNEEEILYEVLKLYRSVIKLNKKEDSAYLSRLIRLSRLAESRGDQELFFDVSKELESIKSKMEMVLEVNEDFMAALQEEIRKQRQQIFRIEKSPNSST